MSMEEQQQLLDKAGFVDIQVIEKCTDCGCYTSGMTSLNYTNSRDPESKRAGIIARFAFGSLFHVVGEMVSPIEDENERRDFVEKALVEFCSGTAPVAMMTYFLRNNSDP